MVEDKREHMLELLDDMYDIVDKALPAEHDWNEFVKLQNELRDLIQEA